MPSQILLDNKIYHPSVNELPCLINYGEKVGGSHFTITMVVDLFLRGEKILMLTAYPMAKDNFLEQIKGHEEKVSYITDISQLNPTAQAIIIESGNEQLYLQVVEKLNDLRERVVLMKNMEVFSETVFTSCLNLEKVILSGDIDRCSVKEKIASKEYKTIIAFTSPKTLLPIDIPTVEKYVGYFWNNKNQGLVTVKM